MPAGAVFWVFVEVVRFECGRVGFGRGFDFPSFWQLSLSSPSPIFPIMAAPAPAPAPGAVGPHVSAAYQAGAPFRPEAFHLAELLSSWDYVTAPDLDIPPSADWTFVGWTLPRTKMRASTSRVGLAGAKNGFSATSLPLRRPRAKTRTARLAVLR